MPKRQLGRRHLRPHGTASAVRAALEPFHGKVYQTSLDTDAEAALHRALDQ